MSSYNKIILLGNLTRDPQLNYLQSGMQVCEFGIACNHKYKSNGQDREETMFIDCCVFGAKAETVNQYFSKGKPILIEGRLKLERWQDQQGNQRSKHKVMIDNFSFVGGGNAQNQAQNNNDNYDVNDDDEIPF